MITFTILLVLLIGLLGGAIYYGYVVVQLKKDETLDVKAMMEELQEWMESEEGQETMAEYNRMVEEAEERLVEEEPVMPVNTIEREGHVGSWIRRESKE